jgi:hypothetical protein
VASHIRLLKLSLPFGDRTILHEFPLKSATAEPSRQMIFARYGEHWLGYRVVNVYLSDKNKPTDPDLWWLHVERVETHSVSSLDKRNAELASFALRHALESYDGMDVGPTGPTH